MENLSACEIADQVRQGRLSARQVMRHYLDRTERLEPALNTYVTLDAAGAMAASEAVDRQVATGHDPGPLTGVPVSVKDLIAVKGLRQTFGSRLFAQNMVTDDAPSVARIRAAGGCIVGKTTTSELGSKAVGTSPLTGATRNPWNQGHTAGGSSAGAAAGVAAGLVPLALGTDGGGSIRIPASFCGLVGIKGSYGRVPVWPASATPGLAHVAPLARNVRDALLLFDVVAGPHEGDPSSLHFGPWQSAPRELAGLRIGWCTDFAYGWADPGLKAVIHDAALRLASALKTVLQPWEGLPADPVQAWSTEFYAGIAQRLKLFESAVPETEAQLDPLLAAQIARARSLGPRALDLAREGRARCAAQVEAAFSRFDLLLMPTMPVEAPPVGRDAPAGHEAEGAVEWSYFTYPFNLAGNPAASYPAGLGPGGLPVGLQLVARIGDEATLFAALLALEQALPVPAFPAL